MLSRWSRIKRLSSGNIGKVKESEVIDFSDIEQCCNELYRPSSENYMALNKWLKICTSAWLEEFLELNGFQTIFCTLRFLEMRWVFRFSSALLQMEIVNCINTILCRNEGMIYLIEGEHDMVDSIMLGKPLGNTFSFYCAPNLNCT